MVFRKQKPKLIINQGKVGILGYSDTLGIESTWIPCLDLPHECKGFSSTSKTRCNEVKIKCNKNNCPFKTAMPIKCNKCNNKELDSILTNNQLYWICPNCKNIQLWKNKKSLSHL